MNEIPRERLEEIDRLVSQATVIEVAAAMDRLVADYGPDAIAHAINYGAGPSRQVRLG